MKLAKPKSLRRKRRVSQLEVAQRSRISPRYYQEIEAARVNMTIATLIKLARAFQVKVQTIVADLPRPNE